MSDKKKKDIPAQEPENETAAPVTEETENTEAPAETKTKYIGLTRDILRLDV